MKLFFTHRLVTLFVLLSALLTTFSPSALAPPQTRPVPGGVAVIDLGPLRKHRRLGTLGSNPRYRQDQQHWFAHSGIPL